MKGWVGLDRRQCYRVRQGAHGGNIDANKSARFIGRVRISFTHHLHDADDFFANIGVVKKRFVTHAHGTQVFRCSVITDARPGIEVDLRLLLPRPSVGFGFKEPVHDGKMQEIEGTDKKPWAQKTAIKKLDPDNLGLLITQP